MSIFASTDPVPDHSYIGILAVSPFLFGHAGDLAPFLHAIFDEVEFSTTNRALRFRAPLTLACKRVLCPPAKSHSETIYSTGIYL
jgi:hypothetical protein